MADELFSEGLYLKVAYPEALRARVAEVVPLWREFCTQGAHLKERFVFPQDAALDAGYKLRKKEENADSKEYFHIVENMRGLFDKYSLMTLVESNPILNRFFLAGEELHASVRAFTIAIATSIEKEVPGVLDQTRKGAPTIVVRFLHYFGKGDSLAQPHFDRSGFTLHLYESRSGLQFLTYDGAWKDAPMDAESTVVFPGHKLEVLSKGKVQKVWHRVERPVTTENQNRYSVVSFVTFPDVPGYDANARSQDQTPGYA